MPAKLTASAPIGAKIDHSICNQSYGCSESGIQDPGGHDVGFGQVIRGAS